LNAAYASFEENIKGSITGSKLADLVILNDDPTEVPPEEIKTIEVAMTVIDGKIVWQRQMNG
jgi:predicted amidohydrolase YtcJ